MQNLLVGVMSCSMLVEMGQLLERCPTTDHLATIRPLAGMGKHVMTQTIAILEAGCAILPLASKLANVFMGILDMSGEIATGDKQGVALGAFEVFCG